MEIVKAYHKSTKEAVESQAARGVKEKELKKSSSGTSSSNVEISPGIFFTGIFIKMTLPVSLGTHFSRQGHVVHPRGHLLTRTF